MDQDLACIIIVSWNSQKDLGGCLDALIRQDYKNFKIICVDNNSSDDSVDFVKTNYPQVELLEMDENLMFTGGNHAGIEHAKSLGAKYIGMINPDTTCTSNWLSSQIDVLENDENVGLVTAKVVYAHGFGTEKKKSKPGMYIINSAGILPGGFLLPYDRGFGELDVGQFDTAEEVYAATGTSLVFRTADYFAVGGFNLSMLMYLEDVDFCLRIKKLGKIIWYEPKSTVYHKHMQSTHQQTGDFYLKHSRSNYLLMVLKNYPFRKFLRALWVNFQDLNFGLFLLSLYVFLKKLIKF